MASIAGKSPAAWLSVYSATKAAVIAYTQAMNKELNGEGIKSVALCPGFVEGTESSRFRVVAIRSTQIARAEAACPFVGCFGREMEQFSDTVSPVAAAPSAHKKRRLMRGSIALSSGAPSSSGRTGELESVCQ